MPIYEYLCEKCGKQFEVMQKITEDPLTTCKECNGPLKKLISQSTFHLKGSGWYVTDYARKSSPSPSQSSKKDKSSASKAGSKKD